MKTSAPLYDIGKDDGGGGGFSFFRALTKSPLPIKPPAELIPGLDTTNLPSLNDFRASAFFGELPEERLKKSQGAKIGAAIPGGFTQKLIEAIESGRHPELLKLLSKFALIDIGAGSERWGYQLALLVKASGYVAVEPYVPDLLFKSLNSTNRLPLPFSIVPEDAERFLKRVPDRAANVLAVGLDSLTIPNREQRTLIERQIERVLPKEGCLLALASDLFVNKHRERVLMFPAGNPKVLHGGWLSSPPKKLSEATIEKAGAQIFEMPDVWRIVSLSDDTDRQRSDFLRQKIPVAWQLDPSQIDFSQNETMQLLVEGARSALLCWQGDNSLSGITIGDVKIDHAAYGRLFDKDCHPIGYYERIVQYGGPEMDRQAVLLHFHSPDKMCFLEGGVSVSPVTVVRNLRDTKLDLEGMFERTVHSMRDVMLHIEQRKVGDKEGFFKSIQAALDGLDSIYAKLRQGKMAEVYIDIDTLFISTFLKALRDYGHTHFDDVIEKVYQGGLDLMTALISRSYTRKWTVDWEQLEGDLAAAKEIAAAHRKT